MKKIMILGASILQQPAIIKAKELGYYVIAVDMNPNAIAFEYADKKKIISTIDTENVLKAAQEEQIEGIMTMASDMPMRTIAKVAKEMNLIGIDEETALNATNKLAMREILLKNEIPIPKFRKINNFEEFKLAINEIKLPCISKPADNSGSRGIFKIENMENLEYIYNYTKENSRNGVTIIEEFMTGPEVSVESLTINGKTHIIAITDKLTTGAPNFVEMGHSQYSLHSPYIQNEIKKITSETIKAIGIENGPSHTEIIITKSGPKIVEIGARLGGDNITSHLVPLSTGFNIVEATIKIAMGDVVKIDYLDKNGAAIRFIPSRKGIIKNIVIDEKIKKIDDLIEFRIEKKIGEHINDIQSSNDRLGYIITKGKSPEEAIEKCSKALELIKIEIGDK